MDERLSHPKRSWCVTAAFRGGPGGRPGVIQRESQATVIGLQPTSVPSLILPPPPPPSGHRLQLLDSRAQVCLRLSLAAARPHVVRKDDERVHEELDLLLVYPTTSRPSSKVRRDIHAPRTRPERHTDPFPRVKVTLVLLHRLVGVPTAQHHRHMEASAPLLQLLTRTRQQR